MSKLSCADESCSEIKKSTAFCNISKVVPA